MIQQEEAVRNLKPAVVKVYDYYQTSMNTHTQLAVVTVSDVMSEGCNIDFTHVFVS